jgi:hypothetical protein
MIVVFFLDVLLGVFRILGSLDPGSADVTGRPGA